MILKRALNPDAARYGDWLVYETNRMRIIESAHTELSANCAASVLNDHSKRCKHDADYQVINRSSVTIV